MELKFVFEVVLIMIVGSIGIIGNCFLIRMFGKLKEKLNFHQLMITLAIFDTIYILLCMIVFAMPEILPEDYKRKGYHFYIAPKAVALLQVTLTGSVYFTISISVERYLTVCHPFYIAGKNWGSKRYIIPIVLFSVLYNLTRFFEMRTKFIEIHEEDYLYNVTKNNETFYSHAQQTGLYSSTSIIGDNNSTIKSDNYTAEDIPITAENMKNSQEYKYEFELTSLRKNKYYYSIYIIGLNFIFNGLIPFAVIIILNVLLYKQLATIISSSRSPFNSRSPSIALAQYGRSLSTTSFQNKNRGSFRRRSIVRRRIKLTEIMLAKVSIGIVIVFVICHSVKWIPNIYELVQRLLQETTKSENIAWPLWVQYITEISHFLTVLNSSVNFYIYYITHYGVPISVSCSIRDSESDSSSSSGIEM